MNKVPAGSDRHHGDHICLDRYFHQEKLKWESEMNTYSHVLLAVDFADTDQRVSRTALDLARRYQAKLSLVHVVEFSPLDYGGEQILPIELKLEEGLVERARMALSELANRLGAPEAGLYVETGSTRAEILRLAKEKAVDLIVVGSHGRRGLALLLGSTANAILHGANCDVLAVRVG